MNSMTKSNNNIRDISNNIIMNRFKLSQPTPLVYPDISGINQYTNILLIENSLPDYQKVVDSMNASTLPIVYSIRSKRSDLLALMRAKFTTIPRIGFFFSSSSGRTKMFLDKEPLFKDDETIPYSENVQFILNIITEFQVKNIDYLACDTLGYPKWVNYYAILTGAGVTVGASNDKTGNIKYGGDWVLESTSQDVELVYFTQSIEYYTYLLDNPSWANIYACIGLAIDTISGYMYVSSVVNTIVRVPINDPGSATNWFSSDLDLPGGLLIYQGYLYVANGGSGTILKINLSDPTTYSIFSTGLNMLYSSVLATDGTYMYVANLNSITQILLSDSNIYNVWFSPEGGETILGIVISDGYLYASTFELTIIQIQINVDGSAGSYNSSWATSTQGLSYSEGLLIYNGYMYVTNLDSNTISQISLTYPNSDYNPSWATSTQGLYFPQAIARDNTYIYVTNQDIISQISLPQPDLPKTTGLIRGRGRITGTGSFYTTL